jgi:hypothetical protein
MDLEECFAQPCFLRPVDPLLPEVHSSLSLLAVLEHSSQRRGNGAAF